MRVLYVNHTGLLGGGERSLLGLLDCLPSTVEARLACPPGRLHEHAVSAGVRTVSITESVGSLKLHPVHTPSALAAMAIASAGVARAARTWRADLIHANSIRAGMIAAPACRALGRPFVLHVRDCLPPSPLTHRIQSSLAARAAAVIAISQHVASTFDPDRTVQRLEVIDNPFDLERLDASRIDREAARARLGLPEDVDVLVLIGQITPWKGQEEAIRALATVRLTHPSARLLIVGETKFVSRATRHDNRSYLRCLHKLVAELGLGDAVRFLGEREDVPEILRASDIALQPSWDEPFGRAVVEAMAMGVPVVATAVGGPAEIIRNGIDGILVGPRRPGELAAAVGGLLDDPARCRAIGAAASESTLKRFNRGRQAAGVAALYDEVNAARAKERRSRLGVLRRQAPDSR